jgi:beta-phosphoglucomutase-like phosphatase (HAD superfamily)
MPKLTSTSESKILACDLGGLLIKTAPCYFRANQRALNELKDPFATFGWNVNEYSESDFRNHNMKTDIGTIGFLRKKISNISISKTITPEKLLEDFSVKRESYFYKEVEDAHKAKNFVEEERVEIITKVITDFSELIFGIVTTKKNNILQRLTNFNNVNHLVQRPNTQIITTDDPELRKKPFPDLYQKLLELVGNHPLIALEDSPRGAVSTLAADGKPLVLINSMTDTSDFPNGTMFLNIQDLPYLIKQFTLWNTSYHYDKKTTSKEIIEQINKVIAK